MAMYARKLIDDCRVAILMSISVLVSEQLISIKAETTGGSAKTLINNQQSTINNRQSAMTERL